MTALNPKPIIAKLEKTGLEGVKKKLAAGSYQPDKIPMIRQWVREQEEKLAKAKAKKKATAEETPPPKTQKTQVKAPPKTKAKTAAKKPATKAPTKGKK